MIYMSLVLLVIFIGLTFFYLIKSKDLKMELNSHKLKLKQSNDELNKYMRSCKERAKERDALQAQLDELLGANSDLEQSEEQGNFVRTRKIKHASPETYRNVFDLDINGQRILEDLTARFCKSSYVRGGQDAERESCYRAGQSQVVSFIVSQINQANDPNYKESEE